MKDKKFFKLEKDTFHIVYNKTIDREDFTKELEEVYNKHYKKNYKHDGFREGHVPFEVATTNGKLASSLLQTVVMIDRQIFLEDIIEDVSLIGSVYDIKDGEGQTDFEEFDLTSKEPVVLQLEVELASFVDKVNYEDIKIDEKEIKAKK